MAKHSNPAAPTTRKGLNCNSLALFCLLQNYLVGQKLDSVNPYSKPVIYDGGGDLNKSWFVHFYYYSAEKGKMIRAKRSQLPGVPSINRSKTKKERLAQLKVLSDALEILLARGWTPESKIEIEVPAAQEKYTLISAIEKAASIKIDEVSARTAKNYGFTARHFVQWLRKRGQHLLEAKDCKRALITDYLREAAKGKGAKTRNNYLGTLYTLFEKMIEEEIIVRNPCLGIKKLKEISTKHTPYSPEQLKMVMAYLHKHNFTLYQFILVIGYAFLRPSETISLKVNDIDLENRYILLKPEKAKRKQFEKIPIIEKLLPVIEDRCKGKKGADYLFNDPKDPAIPVHGTTYFSKRFKTIKKHLNAKGANLTVNHDIYAMRHTFIQDLYHTLRKSMTVAEAEYTIMPITRHKSPEALRKYIRDYSLELPEDWSGLYSLTF